MWCPKCKTAHLYLIDRQWDYDDGELLSGVEKYYCTECDGKFEREVTYVLEKESEISEAN